MTSAEVKQRAVELGFDLCGVAAVADHMELRFFREWLAGGFAGEMQYLHRTADRRQDVRAVVPAARSVIALATVYNTNRPYSTGAGDEGRALVSRYAWGDDYHQIIGRRMDALIAWMREREGDAFEARAYVDTGPVQERVYAQHAGIGWIGRNTCLINRELGSWLFLSEIICSLSLEPDGPALDQCGTCTLCLEACPTGALVAPHVLDSARCLSYLTIELKGAIPGEYRDSVGAHAYGCDICQDVCPWNLQPPIATDPVWQPRAMFDTPKLADLWRTSDAELRQGLKGSAMSRAGVTRLRRNMAVCAGATGDDDTLAAFDDTHQPSCDDPLVQEHVAWARQRRRA